jgi:hypothetical protein
MSDATYDGFMEQLKRDAETMRKGNAPDVQRVHDLVGAMGQSFTTTVFAFQQVATVRSAISFAKSLAEKHRGEGWTKIVVKETLKSPLNTLRTRYQLTDTADLMERAASLVDSLDDAQVLDLLRWLGTYLSFLARRLRSFLPFYELSIAFEGHRFMTEKAVPPGTQPN